MRDKTLVIGLDGATFDIIDPLIEEGRLKNIKHLIERGVRGNLKSTIPPLSPVAWTSFSTGKNAGKHGIFSFTEL
ncbi:MAG: alkaline phosphatase family protein, partial [Methanosarcinales archaeon]